MSSFLIFPGGEAVNVERIGAVKAVEGGFLVLGNAPDDYLSWCDVPTAVAVAWRDATARLLAGHRPRRPVKQPDWIELAVSADPAWAATQGWAPAAPAAAAPPAAVAPPAPQAPSRPRRGDETPPAAAAA